jgi:uncharacterized protein (DUF433 family)
VTDPEIRNGSPIVAGSTLRVSDLAAYHTLAGLTPDQLSAQFDLDLAQVHAALAYYFRHKSSVDAELRANSEQAAALRQRLAAQGRCATG